ncbi:MAG: hypothetical protein LBJ00_00380 [Planctomycetaceae bacterium]|nr:hypothetical protein [Planctomycetaceae bacterium]
MSYTQVLLKFLKLGTQSQQREAVVQGRSLSPYRLRYKLCLSCFKISEAIVRVQSLSPIPVLL